MEFRLTYDGQLLAHRDDAPIYRRSPHVHALRKRFHEQLRELWHRHPILVAYQRHSSDTGHLRLHPILEHDGFNWRPLVTSTNGLICKLDILMLRSGPPGKTLYDIDNRLKTLFDALRKAKNPDELGARLDTRQFVPTSDEDPFYVLLEDDNLITHVAVTSDTLLEPIVGVPYDEAVRLVIDVTVRPYHVHLNNLHFT